MPSPAYIICSDLRTEDKRTNRISAINIIEKVTVQADLDQMKSAVAGQHLRIAFQATMTSVWLLHANDRGHEFENRIYFVDEDGAEYLELLMPAMKIKPESKGHFHRVQLNFHGLPPLPHPGVWRVANGVRKLGDEEWIVQSFPFVLQGDDEFFAELKRAIPTIRDAQSPVSQTDQG